MIPRIKLHKKLTCICNDVTGKGSSASTTHSCVTSNNIRTINKDVNPDFPSNSADHQENHDETKKNLPEKTQEGAPNNIFFDVDCKEMANIEDIFEKKFLDKDYNIKDEVHDLLERLPWICGDYEPIGENWAIPYSHMLITVDGDVQKSDEDLKKEIDEIFKWRHQNLSNFDVNFTKNQRFDIYQIFVL
ncbi:uncharacterized protein LOC124439214 [Xenia sp. Carnegie-2017]|uniref:uncharacterized protein LOC124439214 n=1 Tax=Xenia sp. Carnegie-2017 TaxID=2897299 RepID=UPI001F032F33|nr:uncharacterized protein LOC124439214 [Xenia sp. Carnegie-2017]